MGWMNRLLGRPPETVTVRDLARVFAVTVAGRTPALVKLLETEGLAEEALRTRFALNPSIETTLGQEKLTADEFAEAAGLVIATLRECDAAWQGGETGGDVMRRVGSLALDRIVGRHDGTAAAKVSSLMFTETNNAFRNSHGIGKKFEVVS